MTDYVWEPVESSHVLALGYSDVGHFIYHAAGNTLSNERVVRLYVAYKDGGVYEFPLITWTTFEQLVAAHSVGKALHLLFPARDFKRVGQLAPEKLRKKE